MLVERVMSVAKGHRGLPPVVNQIAPVVDQIAQVVTQVSLLVAVPIVEKEVKNAPIGTFTTIQTEWVISLLRHQIHHEVVLEEMAKVHFQEAVF